MNINNYLRCIVDKDVGEHELVPGIHMVAVGNGGHHQPAGL